jgi:hypothetical protein
LKNKVANGWFSTQERENWISGFPQEWRSRIELSQYPLISFLAYFYIDILNRVYVQSQALPEDRFASVKYKDFVGQPVGVLKVVCRFLDVPWNIEFERWIERQDFNNMNYKFRESLSEEELLEISEILLGEIPEFDYLQV